jgi:NADH:ubiquinone oxidoreductase subunit E
MSSKRPAKDQPENFEFNSSSLEAANKIISKYPEGKQQSAVMALLYIAQKQNNNWIPLVYHQLENISFRFVLQHLV